MIHWKPDKHSKATLTYQIVNYLRENILTGEWPIGYKLPSQRTLSSIFEVNRSTIVNALEELIADGLIQGNAGGGTTVCNNTWSALSSKNNLRWNSYLTSGSHQQNLEIVQMLNSAEFKEGFIHLSSVELAPDLLGISEMEDAMKSLLGSPINYGYEDPLGSIELRTQLCHYLNTLEIKNVTPENILITSGAMQALQLITMGLIKPNSLVYLEKPSFLYTVKLLQSLGLNLSGIPMGEDGIEIQELITRHKLRKGSMLFTIPTYQNPTGLLVPIEKRQELVAECTKHQLPIIEDDIYREIWYEEEPPPPLKAFDKNGNVLFISSLSKCLSPGLRIGWIVGPETVISRLADIKNQADNGCSSITQSIAAKLFSSGLFYSHNVKLREKAFRRREVTLAALKAYCSDIATWSIPKGGFFIWLTLKMDLSMHEFFMRCYRNGVLLHPGNIYDSGTSRQVRISFSFATEAEIHTGIKIMSQVIHELV